MINMRWLVVICILKTIVYSWKHKTRLRKKLTFLLANKFPKTPFLKVDGAILPGNYLVRKKNKSKQAVREEQDLWPKRAIIMGIPIFFHQGGSFISLVIQTFFWKLCFIGILSKKTYIFTWGTAWWRIISLWDPRQIYGSSILSTDTN